MTTTSVTARLREPEVMAAIRELKDKFTGNRGFRPAVNEMLIAKFRIFPTKGQLSGMLWREGLTMATDASTAGAAAVALAKRRSNYEIEKRRRQRERTARVPTLPPLPSVEAAPPAAVVPVPSPEPEPVPVSPKPSLSRDEPKIAPVPFTMRAPVRPVATAAPVAALPPAPVDRVTPMPPMVTLPTLPRAALGRSLGPVTECVFPIGDPGTSNFRYCDDATLPGRPYCLAHCKNAYMNFKPDRPPNEAVDTFAGMFPERRL